MPARTTTTRRRTTRRSTARTSTDGAAGQLIASLNEVIAENDMLRKQNQRLQTLLSRIGGLIGDVATAVVGDGGRRGAGATRARRAAAAAPAAPPARKTRRKITDPAIL